MRRNDAPTFGHPNPHLTLSPLNHTSIGCVPLEPQRETPHIFAERHNVEWFYSPRQSH